MSAMPRHSFCRIWPRRLPGKFSTSTPASATSWLESLLLRSLLLDLDVGVLAQAGEVRLVLRAAVELAGFLVVGGLLRFGLDHLGDAKQHVAGIRYRHADIRR